MCELYCYPYPAVYEIKVEKFGTHNLFKAITRMLNPPNKNM